jgi:hypothetical protein
VSKAALKNPFAQLLGLKPGRLPATASSRVVVTGRTVTNARLLEEALGTRRRRDAAADEPPDAGDQAEADALRRELQRAYYRQRYQRERQNPERMAKRQAWLEANRDKVRAYKKAYDERMRDHLRETKAAWARRKHAENPQPAREAARRYYERNREAILAKSKAKTEARRAERAATKPPTEAEGKA